MNVTAKEVYLFRKRYQTEDVPLSIVKHFVHSHNVTLLKEVVCLILHRRASNIPGAVGARFSDPQVAEFLGINHGVQVINSEYYAPYLALTSYHGPLIHFFAILRSSTTWTSTSFAKALELSPYLHFFALLDHERAQYLSATQYHDLQFIKAVEFAFSRHSFPSGLATHHKLPYGSEAYTAWIGYGSPRDGPRDHPYLWLGGHSMDHHTIGFHLGTPPSLYNQSVRSILSQLVSIAVSCGLTELLSSFVSGENYLWDYSQHPSTHFYDLHPQLSSTNILYNRVGPNIPFNPTHTVEFFSNLSQLSRQSLTEYLVSQTSNVICPEWMGNTIINTHPLLSYLVSVTLKHQALTFRDKAIAGSNRSFHPARGWTREVSKDYVKPCYFVEAMSSQHRRFFQSLSQLPSRFTFQDDKSKETIEHSYEVTQPQDTPGAAVKPRLKQPLDMAAILLAATADVDNGMESYLEQTFSLTLDDIPFLMDQALADGEHEQRKNNHHQQHQYHHISQVCSTILCPLIGLNLCDAVTLFIDNLPQFLSEMPSENSAHSPMITRFIADLENTELRSRLDYIFQMSTQNSTYGNPVQASLTAHTVSQTPVTQSAADAMNHHPHPASHLYLPTCSNVVISALRSPYIQKNTIQYLVSRRKCKIYSNSNTTAELNAILATLISPTSLKSRKKILKFLLSFFDRNKAFKPQIDIIDILSVLDTRHWRTFFRTKIFEWDDFHTLLSKQYKNTLRIRFYSVNTSPLAMDFLPMIISALHIPSMLQSKDFYRSLSMQQRQDYEHALLFIIQTLLITDSNAEGAFAEPSFALLMEFIFSIRHTTLLTHFFQLGYTVTSADFVLLLSSAHYTLSADDVDIVPPMLEDLSLRAKDSPQYPDFSFIVRPVMGFDPIFNPTYIKSLHDGRQMHKEIVEHAMLPHYNGQYGESSHSYGIHDGNHGLSSALPQDVLNSLLYGHHDTYWDDHKIIVLDGTRLHQEEERVKQLNTLKVPSLHNSSINDDCDTDEEDEEEVQLSLSNRELVRGIDPGKISKHQDLIVYPLPANYQKYLATRLSSNNGHGFRNSTVLECFFSLYSRCTFSFPSFLTDDFFVSLPFSSGLFPIYIFFKMLVPTRPVDPLHIPLLFTERCYTDDFILEYSKHKILSDVIHRMQHPYVPPTKSSRRPQNFYAVLADHPTDMGPRSKPVERQNHKAIVLIMQLIVNKLNLNHTAHQKKSTDGGVLRYYEAARINETLLQPTIDNTKPFDPFHEYYPYSLHYNTNISTNYFATMYRIHPSVDDPGDTSANNNTITSNHHYDPKEEALSTDFNMLKQQMDNSYDYIQSSHITSYVLWKCLIDSISFLPISILYSLFHMCRVTDYAVLANMLDHYLSLGGSLGCIPDHVPPLDSPTPTSTSTAGTIPHSQYSGLQYLSLQPIHYAFHLHPGLLMSVYRLFRLYPTQVALPIPLHVPPPSQHPQGCPPETPGSYLDKAFTDVFLNKFDQLCIRMMCHDDRLYITDRILLLATLQHGCLRTVDPDGGDHHGSELTKLSSLHLTSSSLGSTHNLPLYNNPYLFPSRSLLSRHTLFHETNLSMLLGSNQLRVIEYLLKSDFKLDFKPDPSQHDGRHHQPTTHQTPSRTSVAGDSTIDTMDTIELRQALLARDVFGRTSLHHAVSLSTHTDNNAILHQLHVMLANYMPQSQVRNLFSNPADIKPDYTVNALMPEPQYPISTMDTLPKPAIHQPMAYDTIYDTVLGIYPSQGKNTTRLDMRQSLVSPRFLPSVFPHKLYHNSDDPYSVSNHIYEASYTDEIRFIEDDLARAKTRIQRRIPEYLHELESLGLHDETDKTPSLMATILELIRTIFTQDVESVAIALSETSQAIPQYSSRDVEFRPDKPRHHSSK